MSVIYSKDSFDRFEDDLIELILSHLSIENCFDLRYVSKQWKCLIFDKQMFLRLDNNIDWTQTSNLSKFEITLKSCPNITSIDVRTKYCNSLFKADLIFPLITKYCHKLYEIKLNYKYVHLLEDICKKFGSHLKRIDLQRAVILNNDPETNLKTKECYKLCPNITHIELKYLCNIFIGNEILYKNLKSISLMFGDYYNNDSEDIPRTETLFESNKNSLEEIRITINADNKNANYLKALNSLPILRKLKSLQILSYMHSKDENNIFNAFNKLADNCKQLKKFDLYIPSIIEENNLNSFYQTLKTFSQLKYLSLNIRTIELNLSVHLKSFPNLKYLKLNSGLTRFEDSFFNSIEEYFPNIQFVEINVFFANISDQTFESLSKLRKLQKLIIISFKPMKMISQSVIEKLIKNNRKIEKILIRNKYYKIKLNDKPITQMRQNEDICWVSRIKRYIRSHSFDNIDYIDSEDEDNESNDWNNIL